MYGPPKVDKWCHLSWCAHTRLFCSQFQPMQRDLIVCIYIVSQDIFCTYPYLLQHRHEQQNPGSSLGMLRMLGIQSAKGTQQFSK